MLIFSDAIEMWKLEESENWVGNVKLTPRFEFYVPFDDGEPLKMADGLDQAVYDFESGRLYTAGMTSGVREYTVNGRVGGLTDIITDNAAFILGEYYLTLILRFLFHTKYAAQPAATAGPITTKFMGFIADTAFISTR